MCSLCLSVGVCLYWVSFCVFLSVLCVSVMWANLFCHVSAQDSAVLGKQQASVLIEAITNAVDKRSGLVGEYQEAIGAYKSTKDSKTFSSKRKSLGDRYQSLTEDISSRSKDLYPLDAEASAKVRRERDSMCCCEMVCACAVVR